MSGVLAALFAAAGRQLASFTVTIGGTDPYGFGTVVGTGYGSISASGIFTDATGNSRTIVLIIDGSGNLVLGFSATSVPNTAATFSSIVVNGVTYQRSAATYTADTGTDHYTSWAWANGATNSIGTSGSASLKIIG